jgi:hypothetical protein
MLDMFCLQQSVLHCIYFLIMQGGNIFRSDLDVSKASANRGHTDPPGHLSWQRGVGTNCAAYCSSIRRLCVDLAVMCLILDSVEGWFVILTCCTVIRSSGHVEVQNGLSHLQGVTYLMLMCA